MAGDWTIAAEFIRKELRDLQELAAIHPALRTVAYLLEMAILETSEVQEKPKPKGRAARLH